jgi:3'(2'), 5'-bisphosphate nucleotidase
MHNELKLAVKASILAGIETLRFYKKDIDIEFKDDNSPITLADNYSNNTILKQLLPYKIPILSEESDQKIYSERKQWSRYWLIDPLDGTKEFINKSDEYTVNIALMDSNYPILGVVFAPAKDLLFYGSDSSGAYKVEKVSEKSVNDLFNDNHREKLPNHHDNSFPVLVCSKSHLNTETARFIERIEKCVGNIKTENYGSSLKLCMVAEGSADIYPRLGPTMEWDTAASNAIIEASGMTILQYPQMKKMEYNKENLLNPYFIVFNNKMSKIVASCI